MLFNAELTLAAQKSIEGKKYKISGVQHIPYVSAAEVLSTIPSTRRHIGQEFSVIDGDGISTWHFVGGIADEDLVKVESGGGVQSVTGTGADNADPLNPVVNIPSLQAVTDVGYSTTNNLFSTSPDGAVAIIDASGTFLNSIGLQLTSGVPSIAASNNDASTTIDFSNRVAGSTILKIPDANTGATLAEGATDGTTTVHAGTDGIIDISSLLSGGGTVNTGGEYTPTLTKNTNLSQAYYNGSYYTVINNVVTIMISFEVYATAAGFCSLWVSLPTSFVTFGNCGSGAFYNLSTKDIAPIKVSVVTDVGGAELVFNLPNTGSFKGAVTFLYPITY